MEEILDFPVGYLDGLDLLIRPNPFPHDDMSSLYVMSFDRRRTFSTKMFSCLCILVSLVGFIGIDIKDT